MNLQNRVQGYSGPFSMHTQHSTLLVDRRKEVQLELNSATLIDDSAIYQTTTTTRCYTVLPIWSCSHLYPAIIAALKADQKPISSLDVHQSSGFRQLSTSATEMSSLTFLASRRKQTASQRKSCSNRDTRVSFCIFFEVGGVLVVQHYLTINYDKFMKIFEKQPNTYRNFKVYRQISQILVNTDNEKVPLVHYLPDCRSNVKVSVGEFGTYINQVGTASNVIFIVLF